jgi:hypothetical protein
VPDLQVKGQSIDILGVHRILTPSFEKCLEICGEMPAQLLHSPEDSPIEEDQTRGWLQTAANKVYDEMALAMFQVLPLLQPEDFQGRQPGDWINFCFWPGYRSQILRRRDRLFRVHPATPQEFKDAGVGFWGDPNDAARAQPYYDCSHNRWYHYVTIRPRHLPDDIPYWPGSVWLWFNSQKPRLSPRNFVASLTVTTKPIQGDEEFEVLQLASTEDPDDGDSLGWGNQLATKINGIGVVRDHPEFQFPDRPERDGGRSAEYRAIRLQLQALFMHVLFRATVPKWFDKVKESLREVGFAEVHIERALHDPVALNLADGRARFVCWSTITLQDVLMPPSLGESDGRDLMKSTNIGSATLFCSVPLRPEFICVVRDYIRRVYATIRVFESAISQTNLIREYRRIYSTTTSLVLHHEFHYLLNSQFQDVQQLLASSDPHHIRRRQLAWGMMSAFLAVLYRLGKVRDAHASAADLETARQSFLTPLHELGRQALLPTIRAMAASVYQGHHIQGWATIPALETRDSDTIDVNQLPADQYLTCFLLVNEQIHNFCKHERDGNVSASWTVEWNEETLEIILGYPTPRAQAPLCKTFRYLGELLRESRLGNASVDLKGRILQWEVRLSFGNPGGKK